MFALLIALLPLRGWMGDAMATQMAAGQLQHHQAQAADPAHAGHPAQTAPAPHDCADPADNGSTHAAGGHCESCAACQACHTVALSLAATGLMPVFSALRLASPAADLFASADAALRKKPPIS
ncbi:hypothetical protein [Polaromonas sp. YR568]|uniref:hypothetical protein n=1 Tax=Polaromonas sp. YR568 TaxID=1855301 RepID=UPI00398BD96A